MKLYTTKHGTEGIEVYINNWIVVTLIIIVVLFGTIALMQPQEKAVVSMCK